MKAFTLWQPWASLVIVGAKPNEFREKSYLDREAYRHGPEPGERIAIHAGMRPVHLTEVLQLMKVLRDVADRTGLIAELATPMLQRLIDAPKRQQLLELGAILGTATIGPPVLACDLYGIKVSDSERGDYNWAWPLNDVRRLERPVPMPGQRGFWTVPGTIVGTELTA